MTYGFTSAIDQEIEELKKLIPDLIIVNGPAGLQAEVSSLLKKEAAQQYYLLYLNNSQRSLIKVDLTLPQPICWFDDKYGRASP